MLQQGRICSTCGYGLIAYDIPIVSTSTVVGEHAPAEAVVGGGTIRTVPHRTLRQEGRPRLRGAEISDPVLLSSHADLDADSDSDRPNFA